MIITAGSSRRSILRLSFFSRSWRSSTLSAAIHAGGWCRGRAGAAASSTLLEPAFSSALPETRSSAMAFFSTSLTRFSRTPVLSTSLSGTAAMVSCREAPEASKRGRCRVLPES